jgi:hypothetical protein
MDKRRCAYHFLNSTSMNAECIKVCTYSEITDTTVMDKISGANLFGSLLIEVFDDQ